MKTTPEALRKLADFISKSDDPDTTTALRWAADDIDQLMTERTLLRVKVAQLEARLEVFKRHP